MNGPGHEQFSMAIRTTQTDSDRTYTEGVAAYYDASLGGAVDKLRNFTKFVPRQALSLFLAKQEIFREVLNVHGHIIECGVFLGGGLLSWAQFSAIYEPYNHVRRVVGFDTFSGFPEIRSEDLGADVDYVKSGGLYAPAEADLREGIRLYDLNRPIGHIERVKLVVGDATQTIPRFVEENRHLVVALLYLDFDLYEPTKVAIETFLPRMPKGSIIAFDELDQAYWPGETMAVLETVGLRNLRLRRVPYCPQLSFAVLE